MKLKDIPPEIAHSDVIGEFMHLRAIKVLVTELTKEDLKNKFLRIIEEREGFLLEQEVKDDEVD